MRLSPRARTFLPILVILAALLAAPSVASAHTLRSSTAKSWAQRICNRITQNDEDYICQRVYGARRRSAHAIFYLARLHDPSDGETCRAVIRISLKGRRIIGTLYQGECQVQPNF
jgi:hypothetical protein